MATFGLKCEGVHGIEGGEQITLVSPGVKPGDAFIHMSIWAPKGDGCCGKFKPGKRYALDLKGFDVSVPERRELNPQVADRDTVVAVAASVMESAREDMRPGFADEMSPGTARPLASAEALKQIEDSLSLIASEADEALGEK